MIIFVTLSRSHRSKEHPLQHYAVDPDDRWPCMIRPPGEQVSGKNRTDIGALEWLPKGPRRQIGKGKRKV